MSLGGIKREHDRIADQAHEWLGSDRKASGAMSHGAMQNAQEAMVAAQSGRIPTPSMPDGMRAISFPRRGKPPPAAGAQPRYGMTPEELEELLRRAKSGTHYT